LYVPIFCSLVMMSTNIGMSKMMIQGVGVFRRFRPQRGNNKELSSQIHDFVINIAAMSSAPPRRATMVYSRREVVLVEEWSHAEKYSVYEETEQNGQRLAGKVQQFLSEPPTVEYFPEALHIYQGQDHHDTNNKADIGILVRQKTNSPQNGAQLRDAQKEAYERQMKFEPRCTCCIILAGSSLDTSQVRIIELWKTMQDFDFHESSEWHDLGEEKVVPLVIDMDCDFVEGKRIIISDGDCTKTS